MQGPQRLHKYLGRYVLGYFPSASTDTLTQRNYGPELDSNPLRVYVGKAGSEVRWQDAQANASGFLDLAPPAVPPARCGGASSATAMSRPAIPN